MSSSGAVEIEGGVVAHGSRPQQAVPAGRGWQELSQVPGPSAPAEPVHPWRGLMLDSARTCWSVEVICELIDLMARYRLNRLHWHLTDDSGWRFAVPGYERLTEVGAQLPRPDYSWYANVLPAKRAEAAARARDISTVGHYSAEQIAAVVEHAARQGIEIMPEVDLPGHMAAAIRSYPELGDPRLVDVDPEDWGHPNDLLWPGQAAFDFLTAALTTITDLFPFPVVHIGGDECKHWIWESDPALGARYGGADEADLRGGADRADRADPQAGPAAAPRVDDAMLSVNGPGSGRTGLGPRLQGLFTDHARSVLAGRSRRLGAWDELIGSPTSGDELIVAWRGGVGVPSALESGHEWIYADSQFLYLNRVAGDPATEPPAMFGTITPRDIIEADVPDSSTLRGMQAAVWTEFILERDHLHHQLFPRLLALAERAWCGDATEWEEFAPRLEAETRWLRERGVLTASAPDLTGSPQHE